MSEKAIYKVIHRKWTCFPALFASIVRLNQAKPAASVLEQGLWSQDENQSAIQARTCPTVFVRVKKTGKSLRTGGVRIDWNSFIHNSFLLKLIAAVIELLIGWVLGPFVKRQIMRLHNRNKKVDEGVLTFTGSFVNIFIRIIAIIIALAQIGVNMSVAVGAFSALGLGISLALKENMANVASGMQILVTKPFQVGDYISCDSMEGTVTAIELMFTTLQTFDNQQVVVPNAILISNPITNYSKYPTRRIVFAVPVSVQSSYEEFRQSLQTLMERHSGVMQDPKPKTVVGDYTPDGLGIQIKLVCYARLANYWDVLFDLKNEAEKIRQSEKLNPPVGLVEVLSR